MTSYYGAFPRVVPGGPPAPGSRRAPVGRGNLGLNQLKRVLNDCSIDAREYWENRRYRQRTEVHFHGARAEGAAREIAELLPGHQDVQSLERSRLWGMHRDRDIVILLGGDASYIQRMLSERPDTRPCPRLSGQLGTG